MVGNCVGARTPDLTGKQPDDAGLPFEFSVLLVVHIEDVELTLATGKTPFPGGDTSPQHRRAKRIEEKHGAWPLRQLELRCVPADHAHGRTCASRGPPDSQIPSTDAGQGWIQLHTQHGAKRELGSQQKRPPHSGSKVYKRKLIDWGYGLRPAPTDNHLSKDGGRNAEVGRIVPVGAMPALQVTTSD